MTGIDAMNELAQQARFFYDISPLAGIQLIRLEENAEYLVGDSKNGVRTLLHIRNPRCSKEAILAELQWMQEILKNSLVVVPEPVPGLDGNPVQTLRLPYDDTEYCCVLFKYFSGSPAGEGMGTNGSYFKKLGKVTALLHQSGISLNNAVLLSRTSADALLLEEADHEKSVFAGTVPKESELLFNQALKTIAQRLKAYGRSGKRYGLIHGGLGPEGLHFFNNRITVLNFESCGSGWFLSDCGAFFSPLMKLPVAEGDDVLLWLEGYREIRNLTGEDIAEVPTFLMLHRLALLRRRMLYSKTSSQNVNPAGFISGTAALCKAFLSQ